MEFVQIKALLHDVVKDNSDTDLYSFFIDPRNGVALGGYRRSYGCGDCLVRIQDQNIDMNDLPNEVGSWLYMTNSWDAVTGGLPGKELPDGGREIVDGELAAYKFNNVFAQVNGYFTVLMNPEKICKWIEERTMHSGMADKKINLQVFDGVSADGQFPGEVRIMEDGEVTIAIRTRNGIIPAFIDKQSSLIEPYHLKNGQYYIVKRIGVVEGRHIVRVLRPFKRGVRMVIQGFKNGLLLPGQPRYTVLEEAQTGISSADVLDLPFIEGQQGHFASAPYMHFDLDTMYRALKPMEMFKMVEMRFKDSVTGALISAVPQDGLPMVDAIIGPTSPYKSGKVCTA